MIVGMSIQSFTILHVALSLIGAVAGVVALAALARKVWLPSWHQVFLATTSATVITGFMFPITVLTPGLIVGAISSVLLMIAYIALFRFDGGPWAGPIYASSAMAALYLNLFVLVVQSFMKIPYLARLAPTQSEMPFVLTQLIVFLASVALGVWATFAVRRLSLRMT